MHQSHSSIFIMLEKENLFLNIFSSCVCETSTCSKFLPCPRAEKSIYAISVRLFQSNRFGFFLNFFFIHPAFDMKVLQIFAHKFLTIAKRFLWTRDGNHLGIIRLLRHVLIYFFLSLWNSIGSKGFSLAISFVVIILRKIQLKWNSSIY